MQSTSRRKKWKKNHTNFTKKIVIAHSTIMKKRLQIVLIILTQILIIKYVCFAVNAKTCDCGYYTVL